MLPGGIFNRGEINVKLNIMRADPAGNITLFVLDPVERGQRGKIAEQLMAIEEFHAEQVGFYCPPPARPMATWR